MTDWTYYATATTPSEANTVIGAAQALFAVNPTASVLMETPPGDYVWDRVTSGNAIFDFDNIGVVGSTFVWRGYGATIEFPIAYHAFTGANMLGSWSIEGMHHTRPRIKTSQGNVTAKEFPGGGFAYLTVQLDAGYPTVADIWEDNNTGNHLRRYQRTWRFDGSRLRRPRARSDDVRIRWTTYELISAVDRIWRLRIPKPSEIAPYEIGDFVSIQSKHGGQAYQLTGGVGAGSFTFKDMTWTGEARGFIRGYFSHVTLQDSVIEPKELIDGCWPASSTAGGGAQIGRPPPIPTTPVLITRNKLIGTGDDSVGLFNCSGEVSHNYIRDPLHDRGLLLYLSEGVTGLTTNRFIRAPYSFGNQADAAAAVADD